MQPSSLPHRIAWLTMVYQIAIREARRQNKGYRQHSVKALGQIALALLDTDMNKAIMDIVGPLLSPETDGEAMETDGDETRKADEL